LHSHLLDSVHDPDALLGDGRPWVESNARFGSEVDVITVGRPRSSTSAIDQERTFANARAKPSREAASA